MSSRGWASFRALVVAATICCSQWAYTSSFALAPTIPTRGFLPPRNELREPTAVFSSPEPPESEGDAKSLADLHQELEDAEALVDEISQWLTKAERALHIPTPPIPEPRVLAKTPAELRDEFETAQALATEISQGLDALEDVMNLKP